MDLYLLFYVCLCFAVLSVSCSLLVTCWEMAGLLALLHVLFSCVFVTFPYDVPGQAWYLIVSIPELCLILYFYAHSYPASCSEHLVEML